LGDPIQPEVLLTISIYKQPPDIMYRMVLVPGRMRGVLPVTSKQDQSRLECQ